MSELPILIKPTKCTDMLQFDKTRGVDAIRGQSPEHIYKSTIGVIGY